MGYLVFSLAPLQNSVYAEEAGTLVYIYMYYIYRKVQPESVRKVSDVTQQYSYVWPLGRTTLQYSFFIQKSFI